MYRTIVLAAVALLWCGVQAHSAGGGNYPNYQNWGRKSDYYYTYYYYAPQQYHHVYYYPNYNKQHYYYYNPQKKVYWGRFDTASGKYSVLPDDKKKGKLDDIAEGDFPAAVPLSDVQIPGSKGLKMAAPPSPLN